MPLQDSHEGRNQLAIYELMVTAPGNVQSLMSEEDFQDWQITVLDQNNQSANDRNEDRNS